MSEFEGEQPSEIQQANYEQSMDQMNHDQQYEQQQQYDDSQQFEDSQMDQQGHQQSQNQQYAQDDDEDSEEDDDYNSEEQLRKIKRDLLENLNRERQEKSMDKMHLELLSNKIADEYAEHLLSSDHDKMYFEDKIVKANQFEGHYELCYISAEYEEGVDKTKSHVYDYFMELGYLFLEDSQDKQHILNPEINHIGLGVSRDKDRVVIVLMLSTKALMISRICQGENGGIEVRGKILRASDKEKDKKEIGLFAVKVVNKQDMKEHGSGSGPDKIKYNRNDKEFIATLENHAFDKDKYIECYTRVNPDSIPYGKKNRESEKGPVYKYLDFQMRVPAVVYPDPRFAEEDEAADRERFEQEIRDKQEQERKLQEEKDNEDKLSQDDDYRDEDDEDENMSDEEDSRQDNQEQKQAEKEPVISNKEIREDLERAITEALQQHKDFDDQNQQLQQQIKALRSRNEVYVEKQNEMAMNDHKYLNTLAHVHQIRLDLQQTQKNYNKMAQELQQKLEDKQEKCNQIKVAFMELKQEVAKKAANSRTDKPISEKQIQMWEEQEVEKDKILQELRLENLRLRNSLIKNQKILKKKEELAEGLHLIDFEQLKIENQTLNEKIEERNEDLHKLKKKNTTTVQTLTHTREKLGFIQKRNAELKEENLEYEKQQNEKRSELSKLKVTKDKSQKTVQEYQQLTGISRSNALKEDFEKLKKKVEDLKQERISLVEKLNMMHETIKIYNEKKFENMQMQQQGMTN